MGEHRGERERSGEREGWVNTGVKGSGVVRGRVGEHRGERGGWE